MKRNEITLITSKINLQKFALQDIDFLEFFLLIASKIFLYESVNLK